MDEAGALGLRADQAEEGEVTALEDGFADAHVQVVAVREHQVVRIRRRHADLGLDRLDADALDVRRRRLARELLLALVDPLHAAIGDAFEQPHDRAADVAGAVELQMKAHRRLGPGGQTIGAERLEAQRHRAAAALAERGAEREVAFMGRAALQQRARLVDRDLLEVAAADGAEHLISSHEHARAGLARYRALEGTDSDQRRGLG